MPLFLLIKEFLKNLAHSAPFMPYRKPSKRYWVWNARKEERFLKRLGLAYSGNPEIFDSIPVSIIMPAFDRVNCIDKAIDSVSNQTHKSWELIIVDDGSNDGLNTFVEKYISENRIKYQRKPWGGVSQARNHGLDRAKGKYIFYLDTDNSWYPEYLRNMIVFMEKGELDACYSGTRIVDDSGKIVGYYGEPFIWSECWELNHVDINSFAHKASLLDEGFRFDENLKRLVDWDFILAITALHRTAYAPFLGVEYYDGQKGNRITFTEHLGDDIKNIIAHIQKKHQANIRDASCSSRQIRPSWKEILR